MYCVRLEKPKLRDKLQNDKPPEAEMQERLKKELRELRRKYGKRCVLVSKSH